MTRSILVSLFLLSAVPLAAADAEDAARLYLEEFLPYCPEPPIVQEVDYTAAVPEGMKADLMTIQSDDPNCRGTYLKVVKGDRVYVGQPWVLSGYEGTIPDKIKKFAWERLHESALGTVSDRKTPEGLLEANVDMTTSWGKIRLHGAVDRNGKVFFPGGFHPSSEGARKARLEAMRSVLQSAPVKGADNTKVELVEFSDFQCPSCRHANDWMSRVLAAYGDRITYRRVDFPLMSSHPWAFGAALYGRAIWNQSPESFWQYKTEVYQNQSSLTAFSIEDFAREFVKANDLDLAAFDAAIASDTLKKELLAGVSAGMMAEVNATPTFWVNGQPVAPGADGKHLAEVLKVALEQTGK